MNLFNRNKSKLKLGPDQVAIDIGTRYDSSPLTLPWPYLPHTLVSGVTGSGKSSWTAVMMGEIAGHPQTAICGIDPKRVELAGWRPRCSVLATDPTEITRLLSGLQHLVDYRSDLLESKGLRMWNLTLGPAVFVVIDELAELLAIDNKTIAEALKDPTKAKKTISLAKDVASIRLDMLASLARLARFAGVTIVCATQYPLASVVPSELRSNLAGRIGGRVTGREQIDVALGAGMSDQIDAKSIVATDQGVAHVVGLPGFDQPVRCRSHYPTDQQIIDRAKQTAHLRIPEDDLFNCPPIREAA